MYTEMDRKNDFQYFLDRYDELYKEYGHKFYTIRNKNILGIFDTEDQAIKETSKSFEIGEFIVQECNGDESGYTNYISSWQLIEV